MATGSQHLMPGISKAAAEKLARKFEQNAMVYGRKDEKVEVLDCTTHTENPNLQTVGDQRK